MKNEGNRRRIFSVRTLLLALAGVIVGVSLYSWNSKSLLGDAMPMPFGFGAAVVLSGSMEPTLFVNDLVFVKKTDEAAVGDIVVYQSDGELIIHRVVAVDGETVYTQGDANSALDEPICAEQIKGRMMARIPVAGLLVRLLRRPIVAVLILLLALFLYEMSLRRERSADEAELDALKEEIRQLRGQPDGPREAAAAEQQSSKTSGREEMVP